MVGPGRQALATGARIRRAVVVGLLLSLAVALPASAEPTTYQIREIEALLARLGFDPGAVDGTADERTAEAIMSYQSLAALPMDGRASQTLLDELRAVSEALPELPGGDATQKAALPESDPPAEEPAEPVKLGAVDRVEQPGTPAVIAPPLTDGVWDFALYLASFKEEGSARQEWRRLQSQMPKLLGDMAPRIHRVALADDGVLYRLYAGPFPNLATAKDLCIMISRIGYRCGAEDHGTDASTATTEVVSILPGSASVAAKPGNSETVLIVADGTRAKSAAETQTAVLAELALESFESATTAFESGDCERAMRLYARAFETGGLPVRQLATARNNRGRCLYDQGRYKEAVTEYDLALELESEFAAAYYNRGRARMENGNDRQAEEDLQKAYDLGFGRLNQTP